MANDCIALNGNLNKGCPRAMGSVTGFLLSQNQFEIAYADFDTIATITTKIKAAEPDKVHFFKADLIEQAEDTPVYATENFGKQTKIRTTAGVDKFGIGDVASEVHRNFNNWDDQDAYVMLLTKNGYFVGTRSSDNLNKPV